MSGLEFATKYTGVYSPPEAYTARLADRQETRDSKAEQSADGPYRQNYNQFNLNRAFKTLLKYSQSFFDFPQAF